MEVELAHKIFDEIIRRLDWAAILKKVKDK